ncbi:MAG: diguanylate cyclase [Gammaproteobacteria bacterium]|nr:diguanylate cyclase [Gammaproteobacteria bacterium]
MSGEIQKTHDAQKTIVMLVDDQSIVAEAVRRMLADDPEIEFHYCDQPTRAIDFATELRPTVILQDLVMPDLDGISLVRHYRSNSVTANVPVIVLSTKENPKDKSLAFSVGANDYLVKLPDKIELIARVKAHSRSYLTQLERDEAYRQLQELQAQLEESNATLQLLSCLDGLTGIANRRRFDEFMKNEWKRARREQSVLSMILVDVDMFKAYNDNYGHQQGDDTLKRVANTLSAVLNRPADLLARYGGEEFVVVLPDTDLDGAYKMAERFRGNVMDLNIPHDYSTQKIVTISAGIAACKPSEKENTPERLLEKADKALYAAKEQGRNRIVSYNDLNKKK